MKDNTDLRMVSRFRIWHLVVKDSSIKIGNEGILKQLIKNTVVNMMSLKCYIFRKEMMNMKLALTSWCSREVKRSF